MASAAPITLTYRSSDGLDIQLDAYMPVTGRGPRPAVLFFHGGGCFSGTRKNEGVGYFPWIERGTLERGYIFITADYRLLHPFTGLDQLEDVLELFQFLNDRFNAELPITAGVTLDVDRIIVFGESGGGYIGRLAALHAIPRPAAFVSYYGMGGDMLSDFWFRQATPQTMPWERIKDFLDEGPTMESSIPIHLENGFFTDLRRRTDAFRWISENGLFADYLTGIHGLSKRLALLSVAERAETVPAHIKKALPELCMDTITSHPPTLFVHSVEDSIVPLSESVKTYEQLQKIGVRAELYLIGGEKHGPINQDGSPVTGVEGANEAVFRFIESVLIRG